MTVIDGFRRKIIGEDDYGFYSAGDALTDTAVMTGIKTSIANQQPVQFKQQ